MKKTSTSRTLIEIIESQELKNETDKLDQITEELENDQDSEQLAGENIEEEIIETEEGNKNSTVQQEVDIETKLEASYSSIILDKCIEVDEENDEIESKLTLDKEKERIIEQELKAEIIEQELKDEMRNNMEDESNEDDENKEDEDEIEIDDVDTVDDYDNNTMIRVKEKCKVEINDSKDSSPDDAVEKCDEPCDVKCDETKNKSPKTSDEEKSPSNEEEESDVIKIGEMYMRLDNGSTMSENVTGEGDDDEDVSNLEEELVEHYTEDGKQVECVVNVTLPVIQQPEKVFIPSPSPDPSSEQHTRTDDTSPPVLNRLPSLPTGDSASSLGLDLIPLPPPPPPALAQSEICSDETITFPSPPPPDISMCDVPTTNDTSTPKVTILPSSPAPEATEDFCVSLPPRALSRISERSNSDANAHNHHQVSPRSASPPSEASKGPAEDTMSDQNYTSSEDNDNPPSLCSDLPENANNKCDPPNALPRFLSLEDAQKDQFPSPPSSLLEGTVTIQECGTEMTQIEPDSLFLELSPPEDEEEEYQLALRAEAENGGDGGPLQGGGTLERKREKIPYDFSISSENGVTNKEDEDSESSLHGSMEILEEVATEDHFEHDSTNTDTDDEAGEAGEAQMPRDIFEMSPLAAAIEERGAMGLLQQQQQQQPNQLQHQQQQQQQPQKQQQTQSNEPCDLFDLPALRSRGNEYIL
jgi:hypothetical protein